MNLRVRVSRDVFEKLEKIRLNMGNFERCGLLFGKIEEEQIEVIDLVEIRNVKESSSEFELDPLQSLKAFETAEKEGMEVIGVWHTHPIWIAYPSSRDKRGMENYPGVWIIISKNDIRAYYGDERGFSEVRMDIMEPLQ